MKFLNFSLLVVMLSALVGCQRAPRVHRVEWPVMGTVAAVQWKGDAEVKPLIEEVKKIFKEIETLLNAHNPESELSRLAPLCEADILQRCSPLVRQCYRDAFDWQRKTGNIFNPRWRGEGTLDLGGIAKGYALDVAAAQLFLKYEQDLPELLLDLGGSLFVVKGVWSVGIAGMTEQITLTASQSCATSAEYYRGKHIVDGRTGQPVATRQKSVTVVTRPLRARAIVADALSTTLFIVGEEAGATLLKQLKVEDRVKVYYAGF